MDLMHPYETELLFDRLENWGQHREKVAIDNAIQGAIENFRDREGYWPSKGNDMDMSYVQYGALDSLEIDYDLVGL